MVLNTPSPTRKEDQRSIDLPLYFQRIFPQFGKSQWYDAQVWRSIVQRQPVATMCREHLISRIISLDWKIEPRESSQRDELKDAVKYYTKFFTYTGDYDYTDIIEWICTDLLDLPFGGACEIGRSDDKPDGDILWVKLLDAGTLFPTLNDDFPVGQYVPESTNKQIVYFPRHAINRVYLSPRPEMKRQGWGMAPPEKIFMALMLLDRGDEYYWRLLIDTPEAGILDLGDMEKNSAKEWVEAWRTMLNGIDPYKIPVLYEHTTPAKFIPFSRSPTELMFDKATYKYASLVAAGYGITLSDLGLMQAMSGGGDTLAGTIRNERITRRSGLARIKAKVKYFFDRMLPSTLEWKFVDLDDELSIALGRSRLATVTALNQAMASRMITAQEGRLQMMADGLFSISMPEEIPPEVSNNAVEEAPERPGLLGMPVSPSQGGWGEIRSAFDDEIDRVFSPSDENIVNLLVPIIYNIYEDVLNDVEKSEAGIEYKYFQNVLDLVSNSSYCLLDTEALSNEAIELVNEMLSEKEIVLDREIIETKLSKILRNLQDAVNKCIARSVIIGSHKGIKNMLEMITISDEVDKDGILLESMEIMIKYIHDEMNKYKDFIAESYARSLKSILDKKGVTNAETKK